MERLPYNGGVSRLQQKDCRAGASPARLCAWDTHHEYLYGCRGDNESFISSQCALRIGDLSWQTIPLLKPLKQLWLSSDTGGFLPLY